MRKQTIYIENTAQLTSAILAADTPDCVTEIKIKDTNFKATIGPIWHYDKRQLSAFKRMVRETKKFVSWFKKRR
jgi:hypothetical protein